MDTIGLFKSNRRMSSKTRGGARWEWTKRGIGRAARTSNVQMWQIWKKQEMLLTHAMRTKAYLLIVDVLCRYLIMYIAFGLLSRALLTPATERTLRLPFMEELPLEFRVKVLVLAAVTDLILWVNHPLFVFQSLYMQIRAPMWIGVYQTDNQGEKAFQLLHGFWFWCIFVPRMLRQDGPGAFRLIVTFLRAVRSVWHEISRFRGPGGGKRMFFGYLLAAARTTHEFLTRKVVGPSALLDWLFLTLHFGLLQMAACALFGSSPPPQTNYFDLPAIYRESKSPMPQLLAAPSAANGEDWLDLLSFVGKFCLGCLLLVYLPSVLFGLMGKGMNALVVSN